MSPCPDPSVLDSFMRGALPQGDRVALEDHLDRCPDCSRTMAELARLYGSATMDGLSRSAHATGPGPGAAPAGDFVPGQGARVGRYRLGRVLGAGGMGVVFEAYDPELDRPVAIKLLHPIVGADQGQAVVRLMQEARAMARLAHPNVVAVHDVGRVGEQVFVAMELVEGTTLSGWCKAQPRTLPQILEHFIDAGRGLAAAHEVGLVHRDFKPDNVLIGADGRARVTDFGLARQLLGPSETEPLAAVRPKDDPLHESTVAGAIAGTPAYMAPEQWRGQAVDSRSDQFSFCVALYEAAFGQRPFAGDTWQTLCHNVLEGTMRPVPRSAPRWLAKALVVGLAREPHRRFRSMAELLAALSRPRSIAMRVAAIGGAMAVGAAATVGVLAWMADETTAGAAPVADSEGAAAESEGSGASGAAAASEGAAEPTVDDAVAQCVASVRGAGGVFTDARRASVVEGVRAAEDGTPLVDLVLGPVDRFVAQHDAQAKALCRASGDPAVLAAQRQCLSDAATALDVWASRLLEHESFNVRRAAAASAYALPDLRRCTMLHWLVALPDPPPADQKGQVVLLAAEVASAWADADLMQLTSVAPVAERLQSDAAALGYGPLLADAQHLLGSVAAARYDTDRAAHWLSQAVATAAGARATQTQTAAAIALLVEQGAGQLRPAEAQRWQKHAQAVVERTEDPGFAAALSLANGRVLHATYELVDAGPALEGAIGLAAKAYGRDHPYTARAHLALARLRITQGEAGAARQEASLAVSRLSQALGPHDLELGTAYATLGRAQWLAGELDDAERSATKAEKIAVLSSSLRHDYDHGDALLLLADIASSRGDIEAALAFDKKAAIYHYVGPRKARPLLHKGRHLLAAGRHEEAAAAIEAAVTELSSHHGPDDVRLVELLRELGPAQEAAGQIAAARASLSRALDLADTGLGFGPYKSRSLIDLALFEQRQGNDARALELFDDAHVAWLNAYGMHHPKVTRTLLARADLAFALGKREYAGRLYRSSLEEIEAHYGATSVEAERARTRKLEE